MSKQPPWGLAGLPHPGPRGGPRGVRLTLPGLTGWLSGPLLPPVAERGRWGGVAGSQGPAGVAFSSRSSRVLRPPRVTPVPCWLVVGGGGHGPLCVVHTDMQMTQDRVWKRRSLLPPSVSLGHELSTCGTLGPSVCLSLDLSHSGGRPGHRRQMSPVVLTIVRAALRLWGQFLVQNGLLIFTKMFI